MIIQLGVLCILGSLSATSALPPCVCTRNLKPVCGSDGQTYSNECLLQCAQVSNPQLFMERKGRCDGTSLGPPKDVREAPTCFCTLEYMPICGTDGNTYSNRCMLTCAKRSAPVEIAYSGQCRNKREEPQFPSRCSCPRNISPVCGSDGNTYDNECILNCVSQSKSDLVLQYAGECGNEVKTCSCSSDRNPICGTDGVTYENACYYACAKDTFKDLDTLHDGECISSVQVVGSENCIGCRRNVKLVCGTDGKTYRNPCMLNCARDKDESLHIDYEGPCDSRLTVLDSQLCAGCTRIITPVCGTDGNTYRNPCLLNCARDNDENLHIDYNGPCDYRVKVVEVAENFPCICTKNLRPVCASNGVTFGNKCLMKCAGTDLTVTKEGPCEDGLQFV